jgi:hypothetical protein
LNWSPSKNVGSWDRFDDLVVLDAPQITAGSGIRPGAMVDAMDRRSGTKIIWVAQRPAAGFPDGLILVRKI